MTMKSTVILNNDKAFENVIQVLFMVFKKSLHQCQVASMLLYTLSLKTGAIA